MKNLEIFIFAVNAVLPVILIIFLGYLLKEKGFLSKEFLKTGNKLVFNIFLPVLLFTNIYNIESIHDIQWGLILYCIIIVAVLYFTGILMVKLIPDMKQKGVLLQCIFRSNFALIGVPLAELMAGESGVQSAALVSAFTIPVFNILAVISLSMYNKESQKLTGKDVMKMGADIVKNPLIRGVFLGIIALLAKPYMLSFFSYHNISVDSFSFLGTTLGYLAKISSPLALIVLGGQFDFKKIQGYKFQIMLGVFSRNVLAPVLGVGVMIIMQVVGVVSYNSGVYATLIALFATPVAVSSAIMAEAMQNDGQLAGQLVVWTTICSSIGIFVTVMITRALGFI